MHFHVPGALAHLAPVRKEPGNQLLGTGRPARLAVLDNGLLLLPERRSTASRESRPPGWAGNSGPAGSGPSSASHVRITLTVWTVRGVARSLRPLCQHLDKGRKAVKDFARAYGAKFPKATAKITDDEEVLLAFYDYPAEHWIHLRTTNPIVI
jgi:hypothetical protein